MANVEKKIIPFNWKLNSGGCRRLEPVKLTNKEEMLKWATKRRSTIRQRQTGWSPEWFVPFTFYLGTFAPFSLELQQMVEVCSRPPAIGECVYRCLVLRYPSPPRWCMVSGPPTCGILLKSLPPWWTQWSGCILTPRTLSELPERQTFQRQTHLNDTLNSPPHACYRLGHIGSEMTSRRQDDYGGVSTQSRLWRRVCQHLPFASAAVQKTPKILKLTEAVRWFVVVSVHFVFLELHRPLCHFPQWPIFTVWSAVIWVVGVDNSATWASFTQMSLLMGGVCGMMRAGWNQGEYSVGSHLGAAVSPPQVQSVIIGDFKADRTEDIFSIAVSSHSVASALEFASQLQCPQ